MSLELVRPRYEHPATPTKAPSSAPARVHRPHSREARLVLLVAALTYLGLGLWLALDRHLHLEDPWARMANASYVVRGRQPHLAAIGFVWNPLPSLAMIPLVVLRGLVPAFVEQNLAAVLTTALAMAGAVHQVHGLLVDAKLARTLRLVLAALFAVHPMIAFYGANGMSEAWLLFALAWAARRLSAWLRAGRAADLVSCGVALGVAYLARYEAIAAAAGVTLLVLVHSGLRANGPRRHRWHTAVNDSVLVVLPAAVAFVVWAATSWVIVGHPFETFRSVYGNSAQVGLEGSFIAEQTAADTAGKLAYAAEQLLWLAPPLMVLLPACLAVGLTRRGRPLLGPLVVFGSVVAFQAGAFVHGQTFGWLRFSICAVPLVAVLGGLLAALARGPAVRTATGLLAVGLATTGIVTTWYPMLDYRLGREEAVVLRPILTPERASAADRAKLLRYENEKAVARWLDDQHLPPASVLVDTARGFAIVTNSHRPQQFVITSDDDFEPAVADPAVSGVRLVLAQPESQDALNIAYPTLFEQGTAFLSLVKVFPAPGVGVDWKVYAVTEHL